MFVCSGCLSGILPGKIEQAVQNEILKTDKRIPPLKITHAESFTSEFCALKAIILK